MRGRMWDGSRIGCLERKYSTQLGVPESGPWEAACDEVRRKTSGLICDYFFPAGWRFRLLGFREKLSFRGMRCFIPEKGTKEVI